MTVSRKTLTVAETLFQDEVNLIIDVKTSKQATILDVLNANKISINQSCGGNGTCGTCRIVPQPTPGFIYEMSVYERGAAQDLQLLKDQRLACQCEINRDAAEDTMVIKIVNEPVLES